MLSPAVTSMVIVCVPRSCAGQTKSVSCDRKRNGGPLSWEADSGSFIVTKHIGARGYSQKRVVQLAR